MRRSHLRTRVDSKPTHNMEPIKFQIRPTPRSSTLFSKTKLNKSGFFCIFVASVFTLTVFLSCYFLFRTGDSHQSRRKYGIVIDGGSTGTRIHVFSYTIESGRLVYSFGDGAMKVNPGLSAHAEDPDEAGRSLDELVEFGKGRVPRKLWGETEIRLMATAGMRLLTTEVQERILESCRTVLRKSAFKFRDDWASVISGSDEGLYAWVVANYALGTLGTDSRQTVGIIELGGASAQVTFVSGEPVPPEFSRIVKFGNITYSICSHSFLHFGQNAAFEALTESLTASSYQSAIEALKTHEKGMFIDPCSPKGYYHHPMESWKLAPGSAEKNRYSSSLLSRGNFSECRSAALMLLEKDKEKCSYQQCYIGSTFIPKLQGNFLATENFFYTSKFFGLGQRAFLSDFITAGENFCGEDWLRLRKKHHSLNDDDMSHYCFSSAYIVALLHDSLGIALDDERIEYTNQVGNIPLDWALGAFILQSSFALEEQQQQQPDWITTIIGDESPTLLSLIAITILLMFVAWSISKWRKPQLKTVFDLEKGRYIISRVGRS
ncbi:probable apyrase 6 [Euphorbia lathyris]|uniref:probable apyrase 6 n=1 Tax=Euphorbia lathyris TaxID=212925 RepID=UPI0033142AE7